MPSEAICRWCGEPFPRRSSAGTVPYFCSPEHRRAARLAEQAERGDHHIEGKRVSAYTYRNAGCRCPGCTAAASADLRERRHARDGALLKIQTRTQHKAVAWVRANYPALWERFIVEAYEELGIERRPRGHPTNPRTSAVDRSTLRP